MHRIPPHHYAHVGRKNRLEHVLQDCPGYFELSKKYLFTEVTLIHKLYGTKEKLQTMVSCIINKMWPQEEESEKYLRYWSNK